MMRARLIFFAVLLVALPGCAVILQSWMASQHVIIDDDPLTPTPTITVLNPAIEISYEPAHPRVGDVITVHFNAVDLGMPLYTITLTPGGQIRVLYSDPQPTLTAPLDNALVELVETEVGDSSIQLRALAAGTLLVNINANGEGRMAQMQNGTPLYGFYWTSVAGSVEIVIAP